MAEETATFSFKIDADAEPAAEAAAELEKFRSSIVKSQSALADYRKSASLLKGSSDEVKAAKDKLKAAIDLEKSKISQANIGILKLGGSYDKLTKAQKKGRGETDAGRKAISSVGGPLKGLMEKFDGLKDTMPLLASGWGALAAGVAVGVAAIAIAAAAVAGLTVKFTEWLAETADANRNLALTREAFSGTAANATAWGHVMDWASEKTALTTEKLNDLVVSTEKTYRGFRISGEGMVNAFKASAAAAGAGREDVAGFFNEILSRGKLTGRTFVTPADFAQFRNAGISVKDVYASLGITAGQAARGAIVSTDKMAAALAKLSENRFADINAKKMLSLGAQWDHLKDNLMRFTNDLAGEGGALEPLLKAIKQVADLFDLSTESGQDLKKSITEYGTVISQAIVAHIPDIKVFVREGIKLAGAFIDGAAAVVKFFESSTGLFILKAVLATIGLVLVAIGVAVGVVALGFAALAAPVILLGVAIAGLWEAGKKLVAMDWGSLGHAIVDGIKNGLEAAWEGLKGAVTTMGEGIKSTFKNILGIASPSTEFALYGRQSGQGYQQGITQAQPGVNAATANLADAATSGVESTAVASSPPPKSSGATTNVDSSRTITIENVFNIGGGQNAQEIAQTLQSPSFLDHLQSSLKAALQSAAIPVGVPSVSGG